MSGVNKIAKKIQENLNKVVRVIRQDAPPTGAAPSAKIFSEGSAVFVKTDKGVRLLTAAHVTEGRYATQDLWFQIEPSTSADDKYLKATFVCRDESLDLALYKPAHEEVKTAGFVELAPTSVAAVGTSVHMVGYPKQEWLTTAVYKPQSIMDCVVQSVESPEQSTDDVEKFERIIVSKFPPKGMSGGAFFNDSGELLAVTSGGDGADKGYGVSANSIRKFYEKVPESQQ